MSVKTSNAFSKSILHSKQHMNSESQNKFTSLIIHIYNLATKTTTITIDDKATMKIETSILDYPHPKTMILTNI